MKTTILRLLRGAGVIRLWAGSEWRRRHLLILCYHGFARRDEHEWNPALYITGGQFEQRLNLLRQRGYVVLPLGEALSRLEEGSLPRRAVALTVDDGNYDFLAVAYPILVRRGIPATLYASTYYVLDQRPVFDVMLAYLLWRGVRQGNRTLHILGLDPRPLDTAITAKSLAGEIRRRAQESGLSPNAKDELLAEIASQMGEDYCALCCDRMLSLLSIEELRGLDPGIVDVQLHTHRHRTPDNRELFLRELADNRAALATAGRDPAQLVHFCYPSGVHRPAFLPWLREAGIQSATTCLPGLAVKGQDPLLLPRFIDTSLTPVVEFEGWASGLRHLVRRRRRQFSDVQG